MGLVNADPLGFYEKHSGVHLLLSFEAYAEGKLEKALQHIDDAESLGALTLEQLTLKAVLLTHLDERDRANAIFAEVANKISASADVERAYLKLFCVLYGPLEEGADDEALHGRLIELEVKASISKIFPVSEASEVKSEIDLDSIRKHFAGIPSYRMRSQRTHR